MPDGKTAKNCGLWLPYADAQVGGNPALWALYLDGSVILQKNPVSWRR